MWKLSRCHSSKLVRGGEEERRRKKRKIFGEGKSDDGQTEGQTNSISSYTRTRVALEVHINKTISDGGITVDFSIIKVHTSN